MTQTVTRWDSAASAAVTRQPRRWACVGGTTCADTGTAHHMQAADRSTRKAPSVKPLAAIGNQHHTTYVPATNSRLRRCADPQLDKPLLRQYQRKPVSSKTPDVEAKTTR